MDELVLMFPRDESYRLSEEKITRVLWRGEENSIKSRTLADIVEREGKNMQECIKEKAEEILVANGFDKNGKPLATTVCLTEHETVGISETKNINDINKEDVGGEKQTVTDVDKEPLNTDFSKGNVSDCSGNVIIISDAIKIPKEKVKAAIEKYNKDKPLEKQIDADKVLSAM